jgi:glycosyltransferase involved in cell wall biosynthesis
MKIALISNLYPPYDRGGAEHMVQRMAEEYQRQGHTVSIITTRPWSDGHTFKPIVTEKQGVAIYRYAVPNLFFYTNDGKFPFIVRAIWHTIDLLNIFSAIRIRSILQKIQPDQVITHNLMGMSYFIPGVIRSLSIPHIHVLHDIQLAIRSGLMFQGEEQSLFKNGLLGKIYQLYTRFLFGSPERVLSPSLFLKSFYQERGFFLRSEFIVRRNPLAQHFFAITPGSNKKDKPVTFGFIGQLEKHKGIDVLQQALHKWKDFSCRFEIVGAGALEHQVRALAEHDKRVVFLGKIPNKEVGDWYQQIDCLIVPTLTYENSPTVIMEAFASGTPVIASDIGGTAELIQNTRFGEKVPPGDIDGLVSALKKVKLQLEKETYNSKKIQASVATLGVEEYCKENIL